MVLVGLLWKLEVIEVKKTPLFTTHFYAYVEETVPKLVVSKFTFKNCVNSGVLDGFRNGCYKNIVNTKYQCFSQKRYKLHGFGGIFKRNYCSSGRRYSNILPPPLEKIPSTL